MGDTDGGKKTFGMKKVRCRKGNENGEQHPV